MNKTEIAVAVLLVVMVAAVLYVQRPPTEPDALPLPEMPEATNVPPAAGDEPAIRYPVGPATEETETEAAPPAVPPDSSDAGPDAGESVAPAAIVQPLPTLDESDGALQSELAPLFSAPSFSTLFYTDRLIRRLVVSVDNLTGRQYPRSNYRVAHSIRGQLAVRRVRIYEGDDEKIYLSTDNYARYTSFVKFVSGLDSERLVAVYRRFYPLFQAAYEDLGYRSAYFNDRLVDVIDHLLATPTVTGPIRLVRPHVLFRYADADLEALSAGQKVLIRIGPDNAARLKMKLRELRELLVGVPVGEPGDSPEKASPSEEKTPDM